MENVSEKIYSILKEIASEMGIKDAKFKVECPKDKTHGDLSSNIALIAFAKVKSPLELAGEIVKILNSKYLIHNSDFDKVEIAKPGFINFYFALFWFCPVDDNASGQGGAGQKGLTFGT